MRKGARHQAKQPAPLLSLQPPMHQQSSLLTVGVLAAGDLQAQGSCHACLFRQQR